jgi:hypothetical protein
MARSDSLDEAHDVGVFRDTTPAKVSEQHGIGQIQNPLETRNICVSQGRELAVNEGLQHRVELPHPAPASPPQLRGISTHVARGPRT